MGDGILDTPEGVGEAGRGLPGSTRQWYSRGKPVYRFSSTQPVVMMCAASSRQAPNPADPAPYW